MYLHRPVGLDVLPVDGLHELKHGARGLGRPVPVKDLVLEEHPEVFRLVSVFLGRPGVPCVPPPPAD